MSVTILTGDALAMLRTLESESVQCVVTSPPYYGLRDYGADGQIGLERSPLEFLGALWAVFDEVRRVLRGDGVCFVNIGDSYAGSGKGPSNNLNAANGSSNAHSHLAAERMRRNMTQLENGQAPKVWLPVGDGLKPKDLMLIPQRFAIGMQDRGWWVRSEIVWAKTSAMPESVKDRPTSAWEPIWMFAKSRTYYFDADAVRTPYPETSLNRMKSPIQDMRTGVMGQRLERGVTKGKAQQREYPEVNPNGAMIRNVWTIGPEPFKGEHYAGFPTELPKRCILAGSRPGDTVLDPFLGSGTTALVADRLGRHAIGIELNPKYAEMARKRIDEDAPMVSEPVTVASPQQATLFEAAG